MMGAAGLLLVLVPLVLAGSGPLVLMALVVVVMWLLILRHEKPPSSDVGSIAAFYLIFIRLHNP
jgi:hypothetical protein